MSRQSIHKNAFAGTLALLSCLCIPLCALPGQRPQFMLQGQQLLRGWPVAGSAVLASLGGAPAALRADLSGRCVIRDALMPRLWMWDGVQATAFTAPAVMTDAVPDGDAGVWCCAPHPVGGAVWHMSADGGWRIALLLAETPLRAALLSDEGLLLRVRMPDGGTALQSWDLRRLSLRAQRPMALSAGDIHFDDAGRVLLADPLSAAVLHCEPERLSVMAYTAVPQGMTECLSAGGGCLVGVVSGVTLWWAGPMQPAQSLNLGWPLRLESLTDSGVVAWVPALGEAWRIHPSQGLVGQGLCAAAAEAGDGSGLRHARGAALDLDPDGDGFSTALEFEERTDPGWNGSTPLRVVQLGALLRVESPQHSGALWWIQPGWAAQAAAGPAWISALCGSIDPVGCGYALLTPPVPPGIVLTPWLLDLQQGRLLQGMPLELASW